MNAGLRGAGSLGGRAADFVFFTRPLLLLVSTTFFFAGAANGLESPLEALTLRFLAAAGPNLLLLVLVIASAFVINQVYDVESDKLNEKNFHIARGLVSRREAIVFSAALGIAALLVALTLPDPARGLGIAGLALGVAYSVPPLRLKARPVADMLANGLGFGLLAFALGWLALLPWGQDLLLRAAPYTAAMCAIFLNTTISDEAGDRSAGDRTTCVVIGRSAASRAALALLGAAAALAILAGEAPAAVAAVASIPVFIAVAVEPSGRVSVLASQFAGRALFLIVSAVVPPLAAMGGLAYWAGKVYYSRRFGLDYPRMDGASVKGRKSAEAGGNRRSKRPRGDS